MLRSSAGRDTERIMNVLECFSCLSVWKSLRIRENNLFFICCSNEKEADSLSGHFHLQFCHSLSLCDNLTIWLRKEQVLALYCEYNHNLIF